MKPCRMLSSNQLFFTRPPFLQGSRFSRKGDVFLLLEGSVRDEMHEETWVPCLWEGRIVWFRRSAFLDEGPGPLVEEL